jgi:hypothetical protein
MRKLWIALFMCLTSIANAQISGRLAYTGDGNFFDKDDWGASPIGLALINDAFANSRLVHYDYNSHFPESNSTWVNQMNTSVLGATSRYSIFCPVYNDQANKAGAVSNLRSQINISTSTNRLTVLLAGPAEILYQALQGVPNSTRQYITVLSHSSPYNENTGPHTLAQCTGVIVKRIPNQNTNLNTKQNWSPWFWLRDSSNANNRWLYSRMRASGRADISDAGMLYYVLYGKTNSTPNDWKLKLQ